MPINFSSIQTAAGADGAALLGIIYPYLPALAREGEVLYDQFIAHCLNKEWDKVDSLMFSRMTPAERTNLDVEVLSNLRQANVDQVERINITQQLLLKIVLSLGSAVVSSLVQSEFRMPQEMREAHAKEFYKQAMELSSEVPPGPFVIKRLQSEENHGSHG